MYMTRLKALLVDACRKTFDAEYVEEDFRNIHVSIEFPAERQDYPGIWVDYEPVGELQNAGIGHVEYTTPGDEGNVRALRRWRYQGSASFTLVALTSLERDRLYDEVTRVIAFGLDQPQTSEFRVTIENNGLIACNIDFDEIATAGKAETPGTPWGTDEVVYEVTVALECFGEFVSDIAAMTLVPISAIEVFPYAENQPDPLPDPPNVGWQ